MDTLAEYGRQILSLIVVFSLLGLTVWKLGRSRQPFSGHTLWRKTFWQKMLGPRGRSGDRVLKTVERLVLTPQHTLHVLRFHGQEMLVATHPHGCTLPDGAPELTQGTASRGAGA